jgi:DNA invertase Pin-like site-specific DNA recombinase
MPFYMGQQLWGYARVSTEKETQEVSLEDQERWLRDHARALDAEVEIFREQASAKSILGRPVFAGMLKRLEELPPSKRPRQIAVVAFDRLSRDLTDALLIARSLRAFRVELYVRDAGGLVRAETFGDKLQIIGRGIGAEAENAARADRIRASWDRRRREGKPTSNRSPYGLQLVAERDTPADGDSAKWVKRAFEQYLKGTGTHTIAKDLREHAPLHIVRTSRIGSDGAPIVKTRSYIWTYMSVMKLLRQRRYRGVVVTEELFDQVQERLENKPHQRRERIHAYPLSTAIRCAKCGRVFHGRGTTPSKKATLVDGTEVVYHGKLVRYYECDHAGCGVRINADRLEERFRNEVSRLAANPKLITRWLSGDRGDGSTRELRQDIAALERSTSTEALEAARQRIWDLALNAGPNASRDLEKQLERINAKVDADRVLLSELVGKLERRDTSKRTVEEAQRLLHGFWPRYDRSPYERKRQLVGALTAALGGCTADREGMYWAAATKRTKA